MSETLELLQTIHDLAGRRGVFRQDAYFFVLEALEAAAAEHPERRDVTGEDLLGAVRKLGQERYGVMAPEVFRAWGVRATIDFGRVVFQPGGGRPVEEAGTRFAATSSTSSISRTPSLKAMRGQGPESRLAPPGTGDHFPG
ncbi:MAG: hypothetical protein IPH86_11925 [bacterium]|nr:hypothetical protein [bacterium]